MLTVEFIQSTFKAMLTSYTLFGAEGHALRPDFALLVAEAISTPGKDLDSMFKDVRGTYLADTDRLLDHPGTADAETHDLLVEFRRHVREANYFNPTVAEYATDFLFSLRKHQANPALVAA